MKIGVWFKLALLAFALSLLAWVVYFSLFNSDTSKQESAQFWKNQKKGANFFNEIPLPERFEAAKKLGLTWIRLTPSKWKSHAANAGQGDFLVGSKNRYDGLVEEDLKVLINTLDMAGNSGLKVVLAFLNIPGRRWSQHNQGIQEKKIWESKAAQKSAIQFFGDITARINGHAAVAAINLINEPAPELAGEARLKDWYKGSYEDWERKINGTTQDLNMFYEKAIRKIRSIDQSIPILLDTGFYATPWGIKIMNPLSDPNILYSFHMYEPFAYTFSHRSKAAHTYPGKAPIGETNSLDANIVWSRSQLKKFLEPVREWQKNNKIPDRQIVVGEFGVNRQAPGAREYLADLISIFDEFKWHWAFYSFREDNWDKMDYELGVGQAPWRYWQAIEQGKMPDYNQVRDQSLIQVIRTSLAK